MKRLSTGERRGRKGKTGGKRKHNYDRNGQITRL